jgi:glucokinase
MSGGNDAVIAAMDIGGTHVSAANVDVLRRAVLPGQSFRAPLNSHAPADEVVATLVACASRLPAHAGSRWAVALPGPFDYEQGIGRYTGVGKFDALNGYDLRTALASQLTATGGISFHNDADAFLSGEWWAGAARGHAIAVGITLGTGVGSCFLREGSSLREGPGIPPDGRVDLLRFDGRPLEESVSSQAIRLAYAAAAGEPEPPEVRDIAERARHGDRAARRVFARTFHALGTVLGPCLAAFGPTIVVVGGSIAGAWDLLAEPLTVGLVTGGAANTRLEPAQLGDAAPLLGAAYLAFDSSRAATRPEQPQATEH